MLVTYINNNVFNTIMSTVKLVSWMKKKPVAPWQGSISDWTNNIGKLWTMDHAAPVGVNNLQTRMFNISYQYIQ